MIASAVLAVNVMKAKGSAICTWNWGLKRAPFILHQIVMRNVIGLAFSTSHTREITSKLLR